MRVVLKNNCFPGDIIKVNGMPIMFDEKSEEVVELYGNMSFQLEMIHGEAMIPLDELDNETMYEKSRIVDKVIKKGVKWAVKEAEKIYNDMSLLVNCRYEISGFVDMEYIILEKDAQENHSIFSNLFVDNFNYVYMYPFLVNAKGRLLSIESANKQRVVKSQRKQYVAESAFISGFFDLLIELSIQTAIVKNCCKDNKVYKTISECLAEKNGF